MAVGVVCWGWDCCGIDGAGFSAGAAGCSDDSLESLLIFSSLLLSSSLLILVIGADEAGGLLWLRLGRMPPPSCALALLCLECE